MTFQSFVHRFWHHDRRKPEKTHRAIWVGLMSIALGLIPVPPAAIAQLFNSAVDRLPVAERSALREGRATVSGSGGQFTGRVLVNAPVSTTWAVLTDYDNFERFFPTVEDSRLLQSSGNQRVFEQVNVVQVFPISRRSHIVVSATESYPQQIAFHLVDGDVDALVGVWRLEPVAPYSGATPNQVLVTHEVMVDPGSSATRGIFLDIYEDVLEDTLVAIKHESERRAN